MALREGFEVDVEFLQLTDSAGHKHWLSRGRQLPDWVSDEQLRELVSAGAVFKFGRI